MIGKLRPQIFLSIICATLFSCIAMYVGMKTHEAWCMSCRDHRKAMTLKTVTVQTTKRTAHRVIGQCTTCQSQTSSIVG